MFPVSYALSYNHVLVPVVDISIIQGASSSVLGSVLPVETETQPLDSSSNSQLIPVDYKTDIAKRSKYADRYIKHYQILTGLIDSVICGLDVKIVDQLKEQFSNSRLDIKNLFLASSLLRGVVLRQKVLTLIVKCIAQNSKRCVTDGDREKLLSWIPDSIKCKLKVMEYVHRDHCMNVHRLINGDLDVSLVPSTFKILCLYIARKRARIIIGKYRASLSVGEFFGLIELLNETFERRTGHVLTVMKYLQSFTSQSFDMESLITCNVSDSNTDIQSMACKYQPIKKKKRRIKSASKGLFESKTVKIRIRSISRKRTKEERVPIDETRDSSSKLSGGTLSPGEIRDIRSNLLGGTLPLSDIISTRQSLLENKTPTNLVSRWFRVYKDKVYCSTSMSQKEKNMILEKVEESKKVCKYFLQNTYKLDPEIVSIINRVKRCDVELNELREIRTRLSGEIGSDKCSKIFLRLKKKILARKPELADQIHDIFSSTRKRNIRRLTDSEENIIKSFNDGTIPLDRLKKSIEDLYKFRKDISVKGSLVSYIERSISSGIDPLLILSHLPARLRSAYSIIKACSEEDYAVVQAIRHGSLPFSDLESSANIASRYFSPYMLFGLLLRYGYYARKLNSQEQCSFKLLLVSLESEGLISVNKPCSTSIQTQSRDTEHCEHEHFIGHESVSQPVPGGVLELFEHVIGYDEGMSPQAVSFEEQLSDMMVRYNVGLEKHHDFELDTDDAEVSDSTGLLYDLDIREDDLLYC